MTTLQPVAGFNWLAVSWGSPDEPAAETCSYCEAPIADGDVPLMMWTPSGWCARFCEACQRRWWGFQ